MQKKRVDKKQFIVVAALSVMISGCSVGNLLGGDSVAPQQTRVPVGSELTLPPDLSLRAPTQTTDAYVPNGPVEADPEAPVQQAVAPSVTPKRTGGSLDETLAFYGISKIKPDGRPKTAAELNAELRKAILAEKRKTNPGYGTIFNIGEIFSDG
jgi:hypothetical protein